MNRIEINGHSFTLAQLQHESAPKYVSHVLGVSKETATQLIRTKLKMPASHVAPNPPIITR